MSRRFLLWDHDGVLVDTERLYFEATRASLGGLGVGLSRETYLATMARGASCWELATEHGVDDAAVRTARQERNALYQDLLRTEPIEIPGLEAVLEELASTYRMAIITTARRTDFDLIHASRDLLRHFEFALTIEDYARAKPEPDSYRAGLARFDAEPAQAVVLEDSARGLASARAAGIDCIVVRSAFTSSQDFTGAWRVVDSVGAVPGLLAARA